MNLYENISNNVDTYFDVREMSDDELIKMYYEIQDDIETGQWSSEHSLLPAIEEELESRNITIEDNISDSELKEETDRIEISLGPEKRYVIPGSPEESTLRAVKNTLESIEDKVSVLALDPDHAEVGFANKASGISYISAEFDGSGNITKLTTNAAILDKDFLDLANTLYAKMNGGV